MWPKLSVPVVCWSAMIGITFMFGYLINGIISLEMPIRLIITIIVLWAMGEISIYWVYSQWKSYVKRLKGNPRPPSRLQLLLFKEAFRKEHTLF